MKTIIIIEKDAEGRLWKRTPFVGFGDDDIIFGDDEVTFGGKTINIAGDLTVNVGGTLTVNTDQEDE